MKRILSLILSVALLCACMLTLASCGNGLEGKYEGSFLTDEKDIREILSSIANATDNYDMNVFCEYDYRYLVEIRYFYDAEKYDEKYGEHDFNPNWLGPVSYFINGKVPAFVEAKLGE